MKRIFALLLALLMCAGLLAGCGGNGEENPSSEPTQSGDPTTAPSYEAPTDTAEPDEIELPLTEEDVTFDYWLPNGSSFEDFNTYDDNTFYQWMEEQTGVHLNFSHPASGSERENFQTMVLSADYPDFIQSVKNYYDGGVDKAISDGVIRALNDYVDQYMPHYRAKVYETEEVFVQSISDQGNLWDIHNMISEGQGAWIGLGIREDWLGDAGMTLEDVTTIQGYHDALVAFKNYTYDNEGPLELSSGGFQNGGGVNGSWNVTSVNFNNSGIMNVNGVATYSPYKTIIAFSGECKYNGQEPPLTSAGLNGFPDAKIPKTFKADPYRILIVADMFQTGFDEPLLHTMYVDKMLYDIKAVQTLSRLNRCHPKKYDTFVLDFANKPEIIEESFSRYYRTTILSGKTDPNKLYDLVATMEEYQVHSEEDVERLVNLYLGGADRDKLDPTLDACAAIYKQLETDDQIKFKSAAKAFCRTYGFLGAILPYGNADWERLSIFLNLLIPKLPSPREDDLSQGILETIDLESYRNEARESMSIKLEDSDSEVAPVPTGKVGHIVEPEMDLLSAILSDFNDMFGNINWNDADNVRRQILEIPVMVSKDEKYQNAMRNSDEQSARLESERALQQVIFSIMADNMELFKQFQDNPSFKKWLSDLVFNLTYNKEGKSYEFPQQEH